MQEILSSFFLRGLGGRPIRRPLLPGEVEVMEVRFVNPQQSRWYTQFLNNQHRNHKEIETHLFAVSLVFSSVIGFGILFGR